MNSRASKYLLKHLGLKTRRLVEEFRSGNYRTFFRGQGIELKDVRPYQWGDDIRTIDWNLTARLGSPYVKEFMEERELNVFVILDRSLSMQFGTRRQLKSDHALELFSLISLLTSAQQDRLGLLVYGSNRLSYFPSRKGEAHAMLLLKKLDSLSSGESSLEDALQFCSRTFKRTSFLFIISDFLTPLPVPLLKVLAKRHEVSALVVSDPAEWEIASPTNLLLLDQETKDVFFFETNEKNRAAYRESRFNFYSNLMSFFASQNIVATHCLTSDSSTSSFLTHLHDRSRVKTLR